MSRLRIPQQRTKDVAQCRSRLEADPRCLRGKNAPIFYHNPIAKPAERLKTMWIGFAAAQAEGSRNVETEQGASVWPAGGSRPAILFQHLDDPQVLRKTVAVYGIEHQDIPIWPKTPIAYQVPRIGQGEKSLTCGDWGVIRSSNVRLSLEI
jgi:hypothetical protein